MGFSCPAADKKHEQLFRKLVAESNRNNRTQIKLTYIQDYLNGSKRQTAFRSGKEPDIFPLSAGDFAGY